MEQIQIVNAEVKALLSPELLPVDGTYKDDFWEKNEPLMAVDDFAKLRAWVEENYEEQAKSLASRVMWFIVYLNYSSFIHDGYQYQRKLDLLQDTFNIPKDVAKNPRFLRANGTYRELALPRPLRLLLGVERQMDNMYYLMERDQAKDLSDLKNVAAIMKQFDELEASHKEKLKAYTEAVKDGTIRERNGRILSAATTGSLFS